MTLQTYINVWHSYTHHHCLKRDLRWEVERKKTEAWRGEGMWVGVGEGTKCEREGEWRKQGICKGKYGQEKGKEAGTRDVTE